MKDKDLLKLASKNIIRLLEIVEELNPSYYSQSDLVMYSDDLVQLINDEVPSEDLPTIEKNTSQYFGLEVPPRPRE